MKFDFDPVFATQLPAPAARWKAFPKYNFVGGHNDADLVPVDLLASTAASVLTAEGRTLATYGMRSGPQGHLGLRQVIATLLARRAGMPTDAGDVLVTSGSLQALDLVNAVLLEPGDTVIAERFTYAGVPSRLRRLGVECVPVDVDDDGIRIDDLAEVLGALGARGVRPKYLYTIPSVQNPTGGVMPLQRRRDLLALATEHRVAVFEDDCYADLIWEGERPQTIRSLDDSGRVIYCGTFSKTVAPALRVGYLVADWPVTSRMLSVKNDGGSGALEQMVLAEYAAHHFDEHVRELTDALEKKCDAMIGAVRSSFGPLAEVRRPNGGIFVWVRMPDSVDTSRLAEVAQREGIAINPGADWSAVPADGRHCFRLCFGGASVDEIAAGVQLLADVCRREFPLAARLAA